MKNRFVLKTVVFAIPFLFLLVVAEMFARSIPNSYKYKADWMEKNCDSVKCLVFGNSHMYAGIDPSMINRCFSLSNSGQKLEYDYFLLSKYIDQCQNLSTVILLLDYYNLFDTPFEKVNGSDWNRAIYYNLYMDYPKHSCFSKYHYETACSIYLCSKIEHYLEAILQGKNYKIDCDSLGKGTSYRFNKNSKKELESSYLKIKEKKVSTGFGVEMLNSNLDYLINAIKLCKMQNIRVVLISPPYWHIFNEVLDKDRLKNLYASINKLIIDYNIEYKDYRTDTRFSNNPYYFKDAHHLSDNGAILFTKSLIKDFELYSEE